MTTVFTKSNLLYSGYKETAYPGDDPKLTGKPDSTLLNKSEAYEMAYFINRYMNNHNFTQVSTGQKIEKFIKESSDGHQSHAFWTKKLEADFRL